LNGQSEKKVEGKEGEKKNERSIRSISEERTSGGFVGSESTKRQKTYNAAIADDNNVRSTLQKAYVNHRKPQQRRLAKTERSQGGSSSDRTAVPERACMGSRNRQSLARDYKCMTQSQLVMQVIQDYKDHDQMVKVQKAASPPVLPCWV